MRIRIRFPDGTVKVYEVDVKKCSSIEEIADIVVEQMYREYSKHYTLRNPERYKEAVKRWLYPALMTTLLEKFG